MGGSRTRRRLCFLAVFGTAAWFSMPAVADIQKELATCAGIASERSRLQCYDALVRLPVPNKKQTTYVRVRKNLRSEWSVNIEDRPEGGRDVYLRLPSHDLWVRSDEKADVAELTDLRPTLWIRCAQGRTTAFVDWGVFLDGRGMDVYFKVDGDPVEKKFLKVDATRQRVGQWRNDIIVPTLQDMLGAKRISMRLVPKGLEPMIVRFKIEGLDQAIIPLRRACGW